MNKLIISLLVLFSANLVLAKKQVKHADFFTHHFQMLKEKYDEHCKKRKLIVIN